MAQINQAKILSLAHKIATCTILPMVDTNSHRDLYNALEMCQRSGMSSAEMFDGCLAWLASPKWADLADPEYIYLCRNFSDQIGDINKYFRNCKYGTIVGDTLALLKSLNELDSYIKCVDYFASLEFETCFENNDPRTIKAARALKIARDLDLSYLIDCHDAFFAPYLKRVPEDTFKWSCEGISRQHPIEAGAVVIAPWAISKQRLNEFANNIFTKTSSSGSPFPSNNVVISGGSVLKVLQPQYSAKENIHSDLDIFIYGNNSVTRCAAYESIIEWFAGPNTYYSVIGSVTTIYQMDVRRKFQIISANHNTMYSVIKNFDFTHVKFCYDIKTEQFFGSIDGLRALRTGDSCITNTANLKTTRYIKALYNGFNIVRNPEAEKIVDITNLISDPTEPHMQKIIRDFHGWYYPTSAELEFMNPKDFEDRIIRMIEKDSNSTIVTKDINIAFKHMVIGGNFNNSYESKHYSTFNTLALTNNFSSMKQNVVKLQNKYGVLRIDTCTFKCTDIEINDYAYFIRVQCDDAFAQFVHMVGNNIFKLFRGKTAKNLPIDGHIVTFELSMHRIIGQNNKVSLFRDQRNVALNIEEDLRIGDNITINFLVMMDLVNTGVTFEVIKITKYCDVSMNSVIVIKNLSLGGKAIEY